MKTDLPCILTINGGSSSIKFALYRVEEPLQRRLYGNVDRIGLSGTNLTFHDPEHLPREIELIEAFRQRHPKLPQVACFDTVFHRTLCAQPKLSSLLPGQEVDRRIRGGAGRTGCTGVRGRHRRARAGIHAK